MQRSNFQLILLAFFGLIIVVGVLLFAGYGGMRGPGSNRTTLTFWGTISDGAMVPLLNAFNSEYKDTIGTVVYEEHTTASFESDLVNALASGRGPDLVILPHPLLVRQSERLLPLPYEQFPQRKFLDTYTDGAEMFLSNNGILALPLGVDPLVMYWNKQLFANAALTTPPKYWDEFLTLPEKLTVKDVRGTISQSAVALGGYRNITRAKETLSSLLMQVGDTITAPQFTDAGLGVEPTLGLIGREPSSASESAVRFYVQFSDPAKSAYSWNSALPQSRDYFAAGNLAVYFGLASDLSAIENTNPHLSFDLAALPQVRLAGDGQPSARGYGLYWSVGILKASKNPSAAGQAAYLLSTGNYAGVLAQGLSLAPARRDLLAADTSANARTAVLYRAAISAFGWLDPSPSATDGIFRSMVESLVQGGVTERQALSAARADLAGLSQ